MKRRSLLPHQKFHRPVGVLRLFEWNPAQPIAPADEPEQAPESVEPFSIFSPAEDADETTEIPLELELEFEEDSHWHSFKRNDELARLESVLFLAREPLPSRKLAQHAEIPEGGRVRRLLQELNQAYAEQPCAFQIVEVAGGFQLRTRPQFAPWLVRLQEVPIEIRLSSTAMETLAIIAMKQPVLRVNVESIRGTQCSEMIRQLMEKNLVKIVGRSEELGRPFLYGTTKYFLQVFGLKRLEELTRS